MHLDLKPNNIMIFCNMLVKLIDFGESYHPEVCKGRIYLFMQVIIPVLQSLTAALRCSVMIQGILPTKVMSFRWASFFMNCSMAAIPLISTKIQPSSMKACNTTSPFGYSPLSNFRTTVMSQF